VNESKREWVLPIRPTRGKIMIMNRLYAMLWKLRMVARNLEGMSLFK
jgi:hypothetical protein